MIDLELFKNIITEARHNVDLLDSYSVNQFKSKEKLIDHLFKLNILDLNSQVTILGSWYGSILVPFLYKKVKEIVLLDQDDNVIRIAKNRLFKHYKNIDYLTADVFNLGNFTEKVLQSNLLINTSCEHMPPMNMLSELKNYKGYFAFQSNNMFDIETHINCVNNLNEFKNQLPKNIDILIEDEIKDNRGTRFTIIGKMI